MSQAVNRSATRPAASRHSNAVHWPAIATVCISEARLSKGLFPFCADSTDPPNAGTAASRIAPTAKPGCWLVELKAEQDSTCPEVSPFAAYPTGANSHPITLQTTHLGLLLRGNQQALTSDRSGQCIVQWWLCMGALNTGAGSKLIIQPLTSPSRQAAAHARPPGGSTEKLRLTGASGRHERRVWQGEQGETKAS